MDEAAAMALRGGRS